MDPTLQEQALNETTPPEKLRQLAEQNSELAQLVAKNASADPELLRELGQKASNATRKGVVSNPNTPGEVLDWLAEDLGMSGDRVYEQLGFIRRIIASNPNTLEKTLERLAEDRMETANIGRNIRQAVAGNHNTPLSVLEKLSKDKNS